VSAVAHLAVGGGDSVEALEAVFAAGFVCGGCFVVEHSSGYWVWSLMMDVIRGCNSDDWLYRIQVEEIYDMIKSRQM